MVSASSPSIVTEMGKRRLQAYIFKSCHRISLNAKHFQLLLNEGPTPKLRSEEISAD